MRGVAYLYRDLCVNNVNNKLEALHTYDSRFDNPVTYSIT